MDTYIARCTLSQATNVKIVAVMLKLSIGCRCEIVLPCVTYRFDAKTVIRMRPVQQGKKLLQLFMFMFPMN
jgi:hypothetical protein